MEVVAIIPVKALTEAKSRLEPFLTDTQRSRLVRAMLRRVIGASREAGAEVWVLGADESTRGLASEEGIEWRREGEKDINESLRLVFEETWDAGKSPLFLPGDLPFLQPEDLAGLTSAAVPKPPVRAEIVLSPARNGGGTNAVLIPHRLPFRFRLGPDSFERHMEEARRLGLEPLVHNSNGLARDLDTWEDLQEYEALHPGFLAHMTRGED